MSYSDRSGSELFGLLCFYIFVVGGVSFWTDRNLDFWVSQIKGEEVNIPYWLSFIITFICNGFIIVANLLAELARFAV